jgi:hypothetical protein
VHQREHLPAGSVGTRPVSKVHHLLDHRLDPQALGERGGQQQPTVGDGVAVIEAND